MPVPTLEQKRDNSLRVKKELMKQLQGADFEPAAPRWDDLTLVIGEELQQRDGEEAHLRGRPQRGHLAGGEHGRHVLRRRATARRLASLVKPVITYWVEYRETAPETYEVVAAYYHRMRIQP